MATLSHSWTQSPVCWPPSAQQGNNRSGRASRHAPRDKRRRRRNSGRSREGGCAGRSDRRTYDREECTRSPARLAAEGADPATLSASLRYPDLASGAACHGPAACSSRLASAASESRVQPVPAVGEGDGSEAWEAVAFRSEGDETVADKAVVEALFEPLLHVVRNAIDHGIEAPADRTAAGKPATADVLMHAWREGEHVLVEVSDDGRGVDASIVRTPRHFPWCWRRGGDRLAERRWRRSS